MRIDGLNVYFLDTVVNMEVSMLQVHQFSYNVLNLSMEDKCFGYY